MKQLCCFFFAIFFGLTTSAQSTPEQLANSIAQRMQDSLSLTEVMRQAIYSINMTLHSQKSSMFQKGGTDAAIQHGLQLVENKRDSLYQAVLTVEQLELYRVKKNNLVHSN